MEVPPCCAPPKWGSATHSDSIVNVDEDDTKEEIKKKTKDALLPLHGTGDFDVILMIHLLCILCQLVQTARRYGRPVYTCITALK